MRGDPDSTKSKSMEHKNVKGPEFPLDTTNWLAHVTGCHLGLYGPVWYCSSRYSDHRYCSGT
jgi:hypothetical protein